MRSTPLRPSVIPANAGTLPAFDGLRRRSAIGSKRDSAFTGMTRGGLRRNSRPGPFKSTHGGEDAPWLPVGAVGGDGLSFGIAIASIAEYLPAAAAALSILGARSGSTSAGRFQRLIEEGTNRASCAKWTPVFAHPRCDHKGIAPHSCFFLITHEALTFLRFPLPRATQGGVAARAGVSVLVTDSAQKAAGNGDRRIRTRPRKPFAAERLRIRRSRDHRPVDVRVPTVAAASTSRRDGDSAVQSHGQSKSARIECALPFRSARRRAQMGHGARGRTIPCGAPRSKSIPIRSAGRQAFAGTATVFSQRPVWVARYSISGHRRPGRSRRHRGGIGRVADAQRVHRAGEHLDRSFGDLFLQHQHAERRAALARGPEGEVTTSWTTCSGARSIDDHRVDTARLRDQGHQRASSSATMARAILLAWRSNQ